MSRMKVFLSVTAATLAAICFWSCSDTCTENRNALPLVGFYLAGDNGVKISVDSLTVRGIGAPEDSILSQSSSPISELYLPFRIDSDTTEYIFTRNHEGILRETLVRFIYSRTPRFVSAECGVSYIFGISDIQCSGNLIDSVVCPQGFIDNKNQENLKVYFSNVANQ